MNALKACVILHSNTYTKKLYECSYRESRHDVNSKRTLEIRIPSSEKLPTK